MHARVSRLPQQLGCCVAACAAALLAIQAPTAGGATVSTGRADCGRSDAALLALKAIICKSGLAGGCVPAPGANVTGKGDWPNQAVYLHNLLEALASTSTACLETSTATAVVAWLDPAAAGGGGVFNTWDVFQVQYYDMPRLPGTRIEAPDTLGRKCWAFAYLSQTWRPVPWLNLTAFSHNYTQSVRVTMSLCEKVMANCFVNASYGPARRNGTCPGKIFEFHHLGFDSHGP